MCGATLNFSLTFAMGGIVGGFRVLGMQAGNEPFRQANCRQLTLPDCEDADADCT